jgi:hypothetical protein
MNDRKYSNLVFSELADLVNQNSDSSEILQSVSFELSFRKRNKAKVLKDRVDRLIVALGGQVQCQDNDTGNERNSHELFSKVGLHPEAPDFLIRAARDAYREHYNSARCAPENKDNVEKRLKEIEDIFEEIEDSRII